MVREDVEAKNVVAFRRFLKATTDVNERSLTDIVSRAKRARSIASLDAARTEGQVQIALLSSPEFMQLPASVKSQIRRAAKLYAAFKKGEDA